ncbi:peptidase inhibitor 15-like [Acanthaster planci]|uniref:Peptidase inhibitor 15-like n=1 Tax=Acanthaster planci TaxID=133434 RepID=A0A8B7XM56_ACAPL|nr:peptidase inhibitor 15-like [Acanthaster planci]
MIPTEAAVFVYRLNAEISTRPSSLSWKVIPAEGYKKTPPRPLMMLLLRSFRIASSSILLFIFIVPLLGITVEAGYDNNDGIYERKSSAVFNDLALRTTRHSASRDDPGMGKTRFARQTSGGYSRDDIQAMLNAHIEYRRNVTPPAADMNIITWNTELANLAQGWAQGCVFEHGFPSDPQAYNGLVAQNIWMGSQSYGLTRSVTAWYNEYKDYDYPTATCSAGAVCGHYRVMIYSELESIGCGSAACNNGRDVLTVCNYGPSVPNKGVPYKAGPPCALCASGTGWCNNKLCQSGCDGESEQCKCSLQCRNCGELNSALCKCNCKAGWRGTDCSEPCNDYKSYCNVYNAAACEGDSGAQKDCPATCELCAIISASTPSEAKCCDGKMCESGEVLKESSCECVDYMYLEKTKPNVVAPVTVSWTCVPALAVLVTSIPVLMG